MNIVKALLTLIGIATLTGCAATNFATSPSPATVREEWIRKEIAVWGGTRVFAIGDLEFGLLRYESDTTFTVNPGPPLSKSGTTLIVVIRKVCSGKQMLYRWM